MTTDLEKQFFDTFGIEPREFKSCDVGTFCPYPEKECGTDICPYYRTYKVDYPAISDRILLELIKILSKEFILKMFNNFDDDWALMLNTKDKDEQKWFVSCNGFKNALLSLVLSVCNCSDAAHIKHQVQALFEEG